MVKATTTRMRVTLSSGQMNSKILISMSLAANKGKNSMFLTIHRLLAFSVSYLETRLSI